MGRKGIFREIDIRSSYLDESIEIKWYLPEASAQLEEYQVCIMQDGDDYFRMGRVATLSDKLHQEKLIKDTVFVGIHYKDKFDRQDKYAPDGEKQEAYMKFLVEEVVPFLDDELPCDRTSGRSLMGDSLAGSLALMTALSYPGTFKKVIMQSPYVDENVMKLVNNSDFLDSLSLYHSIGTGETEVETTDGERKDFYRPNLQLHEALKEKAPDYIFHENDGIHTWKSWQQEMEDILKKMFS